MWDMHNRTTEEQARNNRGRSNDGENTPVEAGAAPNDACDNYNVLQRRSLVYLSGQSHD